MWGTSSFIILHPGFGVSSSHRLPYDDQREDQELLKAPRTRGQRAVQKRRLVYGCRVRARLALCSVTATCPGGREGARAPPGGGQVSCGDPWTLSSRLPTRFGIQVRPLGGTSQSLLWSFCGGPVRLCAARVSPAARGFSKAGFTASSLLRHRTWGSRAATAKSGSWGFAEQDARV